MWNFREQGEVWTEKELRLFSLIQQEKKGVVVAFSGGVDSSLVGFLAARLLGERAVLATGESSSLPPEDLLLAQELAKEWGARHKVVELEPFFPREYRENGFERCFYCKKSLYTVLNKFVKQFGLGRILNGTNAEDLGDYRPGLRAAAQALVGQPLAEAGLTKKEVRALAEKLGLANAEKPQAACLASRVPYGLTVSSDLLKKIAQAESFMHALGFPLVRLRHHQEVARLELSPQLFPLALKKREEIQQKLEALGYKYVCLDLQGYRTGSLNPKKPIPSMQNSKASQEREKEG